MDTRELYCKNFCFALYCYKTRSFVAKRYGVCTFDSEQAAQQELNAMCAKGVAYRKDYKVVHAIQSISCLEVCP